MRVQLDRTLQFQSIPPLLPAYNKYMGGVDYLSEKPMVLTENRSDARYVLFFSFLIMPLIMPT